MKPFSEWLPQLANFTVPALRGTVLRLRELRRNEDRVTAREIANVVLCDPLMTLNVLRYSQSRMRARQPTEITTVEHAIMMHGVQPFFKEFASPLILEDVLASHPDGLRGAQYVLSRAYQAALTARHFSALRHDIESEEVLISALLHDLAELLLWCTAPTTAMQLDHMLKMHPGLRSSSAQFAVLGFPLSDLQIKLASDWHLPAMLRTLMDDRETGSPRVRIVRLAVAAARHSAHGWDDPALPDDYIGFHKLTAQPLDQVKRGVRYCAVLAAREWRRFGVPPAAAYLPLLPGEPPVDPLSADLHSAAIRKEILNDVLQQLSAAQLRRVDERALVAVAFYGMEAALGLRRMWLGTVNDKTMLVAPKHTLMLDEGLLPGELGFAVGCKSMFDRLVGLGQSVYYNPAASTTMSQLLPVSLRERLSRRPFFATGLHTQKGKPMALVYADTGAIPVRLNETSYNAFKQICQFLGKALEKSTSN